MQNISQESQKIIKKKQKTEAKINQKSTCICDFF